MLCSDLTYRRAPSFGMKNVVLFLDVELASQSFFGCHVPSSCFKSLLSFHLILYMFALHSFFLNGAWSTTNHGQLYTWTGREAFKVFGCKNQTLYAHFSSEICNYLATISPILLLNFPSSGFWLLRWWVKTFVFIARFNFLSFFSNFRKRRTVYSGVQLKCNSNYISSL